MKSILVSFIMLVSLIMLSVLAHEKEQPSSITGRNNMDTIIKARGLIMQNPKNNEFAIWCYDTERSFTVTNLPDSYRENGLHVFFEGHLTQIAGLHGANRSMLELSAIK